MTVALVNWTSDVALKRVGSSSKQANETRANHSGGAVDARHTHIQPKAVTTEELTK